MRARPDKGDPTLACDFTVMDTEQRERYRMLRRQLSKDLHEARELEDGYAFRHSSKADELMAWQSTSHWSGCAARSSTSPSRSGATGAKCGSR